MNSTLKQTLQHTREDIYAARKCENINDPVDTYVVDYLAMGWTKLFIRLHVIPNAVTMLSMVSGVAGGLLLMQPQLGWNLLGVLLVVLSAVYDASDGQVARLTRHFSRLGRMLDGMSDTLVYITLYLACIVRIYPLHLVEDPALWKLLLAALFLVVYALYVAQCQLADYYKNLHMFMIDNAHGSELSRGKHLKKEMDGAVGFARFAGLCYYLYTRMQERRAPWAQRLLDEVELHGKNDALCDAFYEKSRVLVMRTNLMTFNLRTLVLLLSMLLHVELAGLLFVVVVLEPIRRVLLWKYEQLCKSLLPLVK